MTMTSLTKYIWIKKIKIFKDDDDFFNKAYLNNKRQRNIFEYFYANRLKTVNDKKLMKFFINFHFTFFQSYSYNVDLNDF